MNADWIWNGFEIELKWNEFEMNLNWNEMKLKWNMYWIWNGFELKWFWIEFEFEFEMKWNWNDCWFIYFQIDFVETAHEGEARNGAVAEAGVDLAPFIAGERAVGELEALDEPRDVVDGDGVEAVDEDEELHGAEGVVDVGVVPDVPAEPAAHGVEALEHKVNHLLAVALAERAQKTQPGEAPVHPVHSEVLCGPMLHFVDVLGVQATDKSFVLTTAKLYFFAHFSFFKREIFTRLIIIID